MADEDVEKKWEGVLLRLEPEDKAMLVADAHKAGISIVAYMRRLIESAHLRDSHPGEIQVGGCCAFNSGEGVMIVVQANGQVAGDLLSPDEATTFARGVAKLVRAHRKDKG